MSKTNKKLKNTGFLIILAQLLLIIAGLAFQIMPFFSGTSASAYVWIGRSFALLTYVLLALYCLIRLGKTRALFIVAVLSFAVSILFTIITESGSEGGKNVVLLLSGLELIFVVLFSQNLFRKHRSICLIAFAFALAIAVAILNSIGFDPNSANAASIMFSIWSNVITCLTLMVCFLANSKRLKTISKAEPQPAETKPAQTKPAQTKQAETKQTKTKQTKSK